MITNSSNHWHWWLIQLRVCKTDACYRKNTRNMITFQPSWIGHSSNARLDGGISLHWSPQDPIHWLLYTRIYSCFENKKQERKNFPKPRFSHLKNLERKNIPNEEFPKPFWICFPGKFGNFAVPCASFHHSTQPMTPWPINTKGTERNGTLETSKGSF